MNSHPDMYYTQIYIFLQAIIARKKVFFTFLAEIRRKRCFFLQSKANSLDNGAFSVYYIGMEVVFMKKTNVQRLVTAALFAALICIATMVFAIPLPGGGFANLGDCFVITGGILLGSPLGVLAAAIGSALADLLKGYVAYAPATFVIKGVMALAAYGIYVLRAKKVNAATSVLSSIAAEIIMIGGYYIYECFALGAKTAAIDVPGNCGQAAVGIIAAVIIMTVIRSNAYLKKFFLK